MRLADLASLLLPAAACVSLPRNKQMRPAIWFAPPSSTFSPSVLQHQLSSTTQEWIEVRLGPDSQLMLKNSVSCVSELLSAEECRVLIQAAEDCISHNPRIESSKELFVNVPLCDMDNAARAISRALIHERVLPLLERQLPPGTLTDMFGRSHQLSSMQLRFSRGEPAVNRYIVGGDFSVHCDGCDVTIVVPLNEQGAFEGGGTYFWHEAVERGDAEPNRDAIHINAPLGSGLLFHGNVQHAGKAVEEGVRHLYVASFSCVRQGTDKDV